MSFGSYIDFTKKIPSLVSLLASIVLLAFEGEKLHIMDFLMK